MPAAELNFMFGEYVPKCTHVIDKVYSGYCTIQYMSAGRVELFYDARRYELSGRNFWSAFPGPRVRFHVAAGGTSWAHRYLAFKGPLVHRWERDGLFPILPRTSPGDFAPRFDQLLEQAKRTDRRGVIRAVHLLEGILIDLAETPIEPSAPQPWLTRVMEELDSWVEAGEPDYDALAESAGISPSTFRRRFIEATGTPPHTYLLQQRVAKARQMLGETELPLKTIADRLGYRDVYFFSRQFRKLSGVPPAAYRRSRQG